MSTTQISVAFCIISCYTPHYTEVRIMPTCKLMCEVIMSAQIGSGVVLKNVKVGRSKFEIKSLILEYWLYYIVARGYNCIQCRNYCKLIAQLNA